MRNTTFRDKLGTIISIIGLATIIFGLTLGPMYGLYLWGCVGNPVGIAVWGGVKTFAWFELSGWFLLTFGLVVSDHA